MRTLLFANCRLSKVKVTREIKARHPELAPQMRLDAFYPAIRVTKDIPPRQEDIPQELPCRFYRFRIISLPRIYNLSCRSVAAFQLRTNISRDLLAAGSKEQ